MNCYCTTWWWCIVYYSYIYTHWNKELGRLVITINMCMISYIFYSYIPTCWYKYRTIYLLNIKNIIIDYEPYYEIEMVAQRTLFARWKRFEWFHKWKSLNVKIFPFVINFDKKSFYKIDHLIAHDFYIFFTYLCLLFSNILFFKTIVNGKKVNEMIWILDLILIFIRYCNSLGYSWRNQWI